jgi:hypothetical protein
MTTVALLVASCGGDDVDEPGGPDGPVRSYRIVYEVEGGGEEIVTVRRPFLGRVELEGGAVRVSDAGVLATRSGGAEWARIEVPIALAVGDLRGDLVDVPEDAPQRTLAGRTCRVVDELCIDDAGLVLADERRTAVSVDVDDEPADDLFDVPADAITLSFDAGGGAVEEIAVDGQPGFVETWTLSTVPAGFDHVARYAVAPPPLGAPVESTGMPRTADVALVTDVWVRGADVLLLDQGATVGGAPPPWSAARGEMDVELGELGRGTAVTDPRMNEVRATRPDDGFVRVAGTLPVRELVRIARSLEREGS